ncbi:hypothetical protein VNO78_30565 [Psophocarpus tetragonolobus]|uniref:Glycine-rich protein n=1 Tax=Psophocarpus tetragonolobus TaxID=3891 RepID=A0AAN9RX51_PSOTE
MATLILGMLAMFILVSSEVASTNSEEMTHGVDDAKYSGGGHHGGHGGGCRFGCCGGRYGGVCRRCCGYAGEEAVDAQTQDKPHN